MADSTGKPARRISGTAERILDIAQRIIQERGYGALSYADIATEMGIAKASLHHHFPTKASLGLAVIERHLERSHLALAEILASTGSQVGQLQRYAEIYQSVLDQKLGCLCGMMTAEFAMLPPAMQAVVREFFDFNEKWLAGVIGRGRTAGELRRSPGSDAEVARSVLSGLQGALMLARSQGDPAMLTGTAAGMIAALRTAG
jgi:TetR/AcrR family transcriptional repressor of nem operon